MKAWIEGIDCKMKAWTPSIDLESLSPGRWEGGSVGVPGVVVITSKG